MGANDPRGGAIFDPRGMIGRIYKEYHYTQNMTALGPVVSEKKIFFFNVFRMTPPGPGPYGPQGHGWQDL